MFGLALLLIGGVLIGEKAAEEIICPAPERQEAGQVQDFSSKEESKEGSKIAEKSNTTWREFLQGERPRAAYTEGTDNGGIRQGVGVEPDTSLLHGMGDRSNSRGSSSPSRGVRAGVFKITAYSNGPSDTGKSPGDPGYGITASGLPTVAGRTIAADWDVLPNGTQVYIKGVGYRTVDDVGGGINGQEIDIYMDASPEELDAWGVQYLEVYVVGKEG